MKSASKRLQPVDFENIADLRVQVCDCTAPRHRVRRQWSSAGTHRQWWTLGRDPGSDTTGPTQHWSLRSYQGCILELQTDFGLPNKMDNVTVSY